MKNKCRKIKNEKKGKEKKARKKICQLPAIFLNSRELENLRSFLIHSIFFSSFPSFSRRFLFLHQIFVKKKTSVDIFRKKTSVRLQGEKILWVGCSSIVPCCYLRFFTTLHIFFVFLSMFLNYHISSLHPCLTYIHSIHL